ncbi:hypothetical protein ACFYRK_39990 [Streptomyces sp. NPDC005381]|uniref:hypothetical protein n=1 Tax=Streptomyces sp. NPDC005381 TaxID=3364714 RepID=UPI0036770359
MTPRTHEAPYPSYTTTQRTERNESAMDDLIDRTRAGQRSAHRQPCPAAGPAEAT